MKKTKDVFSTLFGNRVLIENFLPKEEKKTKKVVIELSPKDQAEIDSNASKENLTEMKRFKIKQVGIECHPSLEVGREIYIEKPERYLEPSIAEVLLDGDKILGFIIPERAIAGIY